VERAGITKSSKVTRARRQKSKIIDKNQLYGATGLKNIEKIGITAGRSRTTRRATRYKEKNSKKQDNRGESQKFCVRGLGRPDNSGLAFWA
jgi:hypothetical protein